MEQQFFARNTNIINNIMNMVEQLTKSDLNDMAILKKLTQLTNLAYKVSRMKLPGLAKIATKATDSVKKTVQNIMQSQDVKGIEAEISEVLKQTEPPLNRAERRRLQREQRLGLALAL